jgi:hypothetical protein
VPEEDDEPTSKASGPAAAAKANKKGVVPKEDDLAEVDDEGDD